MTNKPQEPSVWDLPGVRAERTETKGLRRASHRIYEWDTARFGSLRP